MERKCRIRTCSPPACTRFQFNHPNRKLVMNTRRWLTALLVGVALLTVVRLSWIGDASSSYPLPREIMLPDAPKTARDIAPFRSLRRTMAMVDVVRKCGLPDEHHGSGIYIFVYRLQDGSSVGIGTSNLKCLLYVRHVDKSGKSTPLMP